MYIYSNRKRSTRFQQDRKVVMYWDLHGHSRKKNVFVYGCDSSKVEREFFIDNLLVRIHFIIVMIRWTGLAPWEFQFSFPGSLTSTLLGFLYYD